MDAGTLDERLVALWEQHMEYDGKAQGTIRWYVRHLKRFQCFLSLKSQETNTFGKPDIMGFMKWLKCTDEGKRGYWMTIKAYCKWLAACGYAPTDPTLGMRLKFVRTRRPVPPEREHIVALLNYIKKLDNRVAHRDFVYFSLIYFTGLRANEALHLLVRDIDFKAGLIRVRRGKGGKTRDVPMIDAAAKLLIAWIGRCNGDDDHLFKTAQGGKPASNFTMIERWRRYQWGFGVPRGRTMTIHDIRHAFATHAAESGCVDALDLQEILGHAQLSTVTIYWHQNKKVLRGKLNRAFEAA